MSTLALLGGEPVRQKEFAGSALVDEREIASVLEVFENNEFSRYAGGTVPDIQKILSLKSRAGLDYPLNYWNFLGGTKVRQFEKDFAEYFGADYAIAVNSATSGLSVALAAVGCGPGDEVICPSISFTATGTSILLFNSIPRFVDVDPHTFCAEPESIERNINARTRAILLVHLLGNACNMDRIMGIAREHGLMVIEDCAQAIGATYDGRPVGTIGDMGVFSFQETKNIMTGEGGMILTNNAEYAAKSRCVRNHGEVTVTDESAIELLENNIGCNFRMAELTAAVGIEQLKKLAEKNRLRNENARFLREKLAAFKGFGFMEFEPKTEGVYHLFPMVYEERVWGIPRQVFIAAMNSEGIPVSGSYPRLLYENPMFLKKIGYGRAGCPFTCPLYNGDVEYCRGLTPVAERLVHEQFIWFFAIYTPNTVEDMQDVVRAVEKIDQNRDALRQFGEAALEKVRDRIAFR